MTDRPFEPLCAYPVWQVEFLAKGSALPHTGRIVKAGDFIVAAHKPRPIVREKQVMSTHPFDTDFQITPEHKEQFRRERGFRPVPKERVER